jgi:hypothetical protein
LFDVYAQGNGVSVWLIDDDGAAHYLHDTLHPSFFVGGSAVELRRVCEWITRARLPTRLKRAERHDAFAHRDLVVLQVQVLIPAQYAAIVHRVNNTFPTLDLYNADVCIAQFYFFERGLFPLAYCTALINDAHAIAEIHTDDSRWALEYRLPPLRCMLIQLEGGTLNPNHGHRRAARNHLRRSDLRRRNPGRAPSRRARARTSATRRPRCDCQSLGRFVHLAATV